MITENNSNKLNILVGVITEKQLVQMRTLTSEKTFYV